MRRGQFLSTALALVLSLALVGCGDGAVTESAGSVAPTGSVPGEGLRWPSEEYYAGWFDRDGEMVFRYFSDHADAAVAELEAHGHGGLPSRYSSAEWQQNEGGDLRHGTVPRRTPRYRLPRRRRPV
jgi:hypothetical protein